MLISICFLIHSYSAVILQYFIFTNYWLNLFWCIVRCFFWWARVAVGWVFCLFIISISIEVSCIFWHFIGSFSILLHLQYFLYLATSNVFVDFWSLHNLFWLSTSISIIVVYDLFFMIYLVYDLFYSWRSSIVSLLLYCSNWFVMSAMLS